MTKQNMFQAQQSTGFRQDKRRRSLCVYSAHIQSELIYSVYLSEDADHILITTLLLLFTFS